MTVLEGGGGQCFCDDSTKALVITAWGWGESKIVKLGDVIYGQPLIGIISYYFKIGCKNEYSNSGVIFLTIEH